MDYKIELAPIPVTDIDRARDFYVKQAGFTLDHDSSVGDEIRFVQLTPPGSACSIVLGKGVTEMEPGTQRGLLMVVASIEAARDDFRSRGLDLGEVDEQQWGRFLYFTDPDGNTWSLQELPDYSSSEWQAGQADLVDNR